MRNCVFLAYGDNAIQEVQAALPAHTQFLSPSSPFYYVIGLTYSKTVMTRTSIALYRGWSKLVFESLDITKTRLFKYTENLSQKIEYFQIKNSNFFIFLLMNICAYIN